MEYLDVDEAEHHNKHHRSYGEEDYVSLAPVKYVFKHDLHLCNGFASKIIVSKGGLNTLETPV
jgi:hypothetical protein